MNLREYDVLEPINAWVGHLFDRRNVDQTVAALVASQDGGAKSGERAAAEKRFTDAEKRLRRFQDAIGAGIDARVLWSTPLTRRSLSEPPRGPSLTALRCRPRLPMPRSTR